MKVKKFLRNLTFGLALTSFSLANFYQPVFAAELHEVGKDNVISNYRSNYNNNRIAVTSDGNAHDQDDFAATAATLALLAAADLKGNLVHYDYNNNIADHSEQFPLSFNQEMRDTVANSNYFFGYNATDLLGTTADNLFFDDNLFADNAVAHLKREIEKSTAADPLYVILGGPPEILYMAWNAATKGKEHVIVISHSLWNNLWEKMENSSTMHSTDDCKGMKIIQIKDQNSATLETGEKVPKYCIFGSATKKAETKAQYNDLYRSVSWLKKAKNPGLQYIYQRLEDMDREEDAIDKADMSDVGMVYFMLTNDEDSDYNTLKNYFAEHNFLNADLRKNTNVDYKKIYQEVAYQPTRKIKLGTYLESLSSLPETVAVVMGDNKTVKDVPVTWDTSKYKKEPGEYIILGKLANIDGYQNLANRVAVIKLIVE